MLMCVESCEWIILIVRCFLLLDAPICWMLLFVGYSYLLDTPYSFFFRLVVSLFRLSQETLGEDLHWDPNRNEAYSHDGA